jgi:hypothetical protein
MTDSNKFESVARMYLRSYSGKVTVNNSKGSEGEITNQGKNQSMYHG